MERSALTPRLNFRDIVSWVTEHNAELCVSERANENDLKIIIPLRED